MNDGTHAADRFIARALAPLPDGQEREREERDLRERLQIHAACMEAEVVEMEKMLERYDARPWLLRNWIRVLALVMLVVCVPLLVWVVGRILVAARDISGLSGTTAKKESVNLAVMLKDPTPEGRLLVEGKRGAPDDGARWRPLWDSAPDDPRMLALYARGYYSANKRLSPEIAEAAQRIDPDNGWFIIMEAAGIAGKAVTRGKVSEKERKAGKAAGMTVNDAAALDQAIALVRRARSLTRFETYQTDIHRMRMERLRPAEDFVGKVYRMVVVMADGKPALWDARNVHNALAASAQRCADAGDAAGFDLAVEDCIWLFHVSIGQADSVIDQMLARACFSSILRNLRDAARKLGRDDQAKRFDLLDQAVREQREQVRKLNDENRVTSDLLTDRGSLMSGFMTHASWVALNPPAITGEDVKPGRFVDHAMLGRLFSGTIWGFLGGVVLVLAVRLPQPLARRLANLLGWRDWLWVLGVGVVGPVVWFVWVTRYTPLSARESAIMRTLLVQPGLQYGALLWMIILTPLAVARWRVARRCRTLGMTVPGLRWDWLGAVCAALAVPLFGLGGTWWFRMEILGPGVLVLFGWPMLRMLVQTWNCSRKDSPHRLWQGVVLAAALPAWLFAMLLCGVGLRAFEAEERYWVRQDRLMGVPDDQPVSSRYEAELVEVLRGETAELFKPLDTMSRE